MHKTPALSDNETVIEYFSSKTVFDARKRKAFRRRVVVVVVAGLKILTVVYFGFGDLFEADDAAARMPHFEVVAPFIR